MTTLLEQAQAALRDINARTEAHNAELLFPAVYGRPAPAPLPPPPPPPVTYPCGMAAKASELLDLMRSAPWQRRKRLVCDDRLVAAAMWKANDLASHNLWSHVASNGETANETIRRFDYSLPGQYAGRGNNTESLCGGTDDPAFALKLLVEHEGHRQHITGEGFFGRQECAGVGFITSTIGFPFYFVVLTAHCSAAG